jgi:hypothetical protein
MVRECHCDKTSLARVRVLRHYELYLPARAKAGQEQRNFLWPFLGMLSRRLIHRALADASGFDDGLASDRNPKASARERYGGWLWQSPRCRGLGIAIELPIRIQSRKFRTGRVLQFSGASKTQPQPPLADASGFDDGLASDRNPKASARERSGGWLWQSPRCHGLGIAIEFPIRIQSRKFRTGRVLQFSGASKTQPQPPFADAFGFR